MILCSLLLFPQTRWAWGPEEQSELEKSLAPREVPTHWLARTILLSFFSWMLLILNTLALTLLPIMTGRILFYLLQLPIYVQHDPISYIIGACVCVAILTMGQSLFRLCSSSTKMRGIRKAVFQLPRVAVFKSKSFHAFYLSALSRYNEPALLYSREES